MRKNSEVFTLKKYKGFIISIAFLLIISSLIMACPTSPVSAKSANDTASKTTYQSSYVIEPQYKYAFPFQEGLAWVHTEEGWGAIDTTGKWAIPPITKNLIEDPILLFKDGITWVEFTDGYKPINKEGEFITNKKYKYYRNFSEGLAAVLDANNKWGFIDKAGKEVVKPKYQGVMDFKDGVARVENSSSKFGFINQTGEEIVKPQYDNISYFHESLALVERDGKYGYINKSGELVIDFIYEDASKFEDGFASVRLNYKGYYINSNGKMFSEKNIDGLTIFTENYQKGLKDKNGRLLLDPVYYHIGGFHEGIAKVATTEWLFGLIDKSGNFIVEPTYHNIYDFNEGLASVEKDEQFGVITKAGKVIVKPQYEYISKFENGVAMILEDNKYGLIDKNGKVILQPHYDFMDEFKEGVAKVSVNGKDGFIDKTGQEVIKPQYVSHTVINRHTGTFNAPMNAIAGAGYSANGLIRVFVDGKFGYIANPVHAGEIKEDMTKHTKHLLEKAINNSMKTWTIKFNTEINADTFNSDNVYVVDGNGKVLTTIVDYKEGKQEGVINAPAFGYKRGEHYTLIVKEGVRSTTGKTLSQGVELNFSISGEEE